MSNYTTYITSATVRFYEKIYRFPNSTKYVWAIKLEDCPRCSEHNRIYIRLSDSYEKAQTVISALRHHLARNRIYDGTKATIILNADGFVAIGTNGDDNYCDIRDNFKVKSFSQLGLNITSLVVNNH